MTSSVVAVLEVLLTQPDAARYGLELGTRTGLASGTIHPVLARLERAGWVESAWEDVDPGDVGRPRRRFYRLTAEGVGAAAAALAAAEARRAALRRRGGHAGAAVPATGG
jgi:DNA-binding PadR family transcriptional regulator